MLLRNVGTNRLRGCHRPCRVRGGRTSGLGMVSIITTIMVIVVADTDSRLEVAIVVEEAVDEVDVDRTHDNNRTMDDLDDPQSSCHSLHPPSPQPPPRLSPRLFPQAARMNLRDPSRPTRAITLRRAKTVHRDPTRNDRRETNDRG